MKKSLSILALLLTLCVSFAACAESGDLLADILARGEMSIALEGTYPPWNYYDENDVLVGYDVEVAQSVCDRMSVKANFIPCEWDGIFAGLDAGRYDTVANEVEVTEERAKKYDFSAPYAYIRTAIIVAADNTEISSFEDLNGKTTCNTVTSTYAALAESYGATVTGVDNLAETLELVMHGRCDATLNADVSFYDYMKAHPDAPLKIVAYTDDPVLAVFPVRKGGESDALLTAINEALAALDTDGTLTALSQKYFGADVSKAE